MKTRVITGIGIILVAIVLVALASFTPIYCIGMAALAVTVEVGNVFMEVDHVYPDLTIHLTLFNARITEGAIRLLEHNDAKWITVNEIDDFDFCPADEEILERLKLRK